MKKQIAVASAIALLGMASLAQGQPPTTSDPNGRLVAGFDMPGMFPETVTAANIGIRPLSGVFFDGDGEDFLETTFPSAGPIAWTSSRINSGDAAISIGPADPNNPLYYPPAGFENNFQAANTGGSINTSNNDLSTLAWRVNINTGALLATTRHNGVDDGYLTPSGGSVGEILGVSYFIDGFSQGWGFRMNDGVFDNGGNGSSDLVTGAAGAANGRHEASFNVATAYFPYEQGWLGAWVAGASDGAASFSASSDSVDATAVNWSGGVASVSLPGIDSAEDGMLFVAPTDSSSQTRIASAFPNTSGGWTTTMRLDENADTTGQTILTSGNGFQFFYLPYDAQNLIGGHVAGDTGLSINSAGDNQFSLTRTATGQYALSVFESDGETRRLEDDGILILSVADTMAGNATLGSRAFLSYEYDSGSGDFLIEAHELISINSLTPDDGFGNEFAFVDTDFYFAWVDFANPLAPATALAGDYNGDGVVNAADYTVWRDTQGSTTDFSADGNGDMMVDATDYAIWRSNFGQTAGSGSLQGSSGAVPEPGSVVLAIVALCGLAVGCQNWKRV